MSERISISSFLCCCRRSETKSLTKHSGNILSKQSLKEIEECDDVSISVTVPPTEASNSRELTHLWSSGSFTSEEKSCDVQQQQRAEAENGNSAGQSQSTDAATPVLPSWLNSCLSAESEAESEAEGAQQTMMERSKVDVLQSSLDTLRPIGDDELASSDGQPSLECLVAFEKIIVQLETLASRLEKENGATRPISDVVSVSDQDRPSIYLDDGQWTVANNSGNSHLVLKMTDEHQSVKICDGSGCTIRIEGKAEIITIDNCIKCDVTFQETSKPVTLADCRRLQLQKEIYLPEQFQSRWVVDRWVTGVMDIMS